MNDRELMLIAIEEAKNSDEFVGCGVVVAKDGRVIVKTHNQQRATNNATAHAEILAIAEAGKVLERKNLDDCVMYCTCEPCSMCLSAIVFAKVPKVFFGTSMLESFPDHLPINLASDQLLAHSVHKVEMQGGFCKDECFALLKSVD
jgi:tRNA(adenine34) deaminase